MSAAVARVVMGALLVLPLDVPPAQAQYRDPAPGVGLDAFIARELHDASNAAAAVVIGDSLVYQRAFAAEGAEGGSVEPVFRAGALTEIVTALAAAQMEAAGALDLERPISTYAVGLPPRLGEATLAQLLTHSAGLDDAEEPPRKPAAGTLEAFAASLTDGVLFADPGSLYSLSRYDYPLIGYVLEQVAGKPFARVVSERVFEPLAMTHSSIGHPAGGTGLVAGWEQAATADAPMVRVPDVPDSAAALPALGLYTSGGDLARLALALMNGGSVGGTQAIAPAAVARIWQLRVRDWEDGDGQETYGCGLITTPTHGVAEAIALGGARGFSATLRLVPRARVAFLALANATGNSLYRAGDLTFARLLRDAGAAAASGRGPAPAPPKETAIDAASFAGVYVNGDRMIVLEVTEQGLGARDGDRLLPVHGRSDRSLLVTVEDGRPAYLLRPANDAQGNRYLYLNGHAYRWDRERLEDPPSS